MTNLFKFWSCIFLISALSIWFTIWANSLEPLVESSIAFETKPTTKKIAPHQDIGTLFYDLGIIQPSHGILNPCFDLESYALKWCKLPAMNQILDERYLVEMDELLLKEMLRHENPCQQISSYIGRVCEQENFKKIFKHFSIKK